MSAEQEVERVLAYLRQHRNQYSLPALQQQLVASGQDPAIIERAMALMQAEATPAPRRNSWLLGFGFSFLNNLMLSLVGPFLDSIFYTNGDFIVGTIGLTLLVELVAGLLLLRGKQAYWGRVLLFTVLFSLVIPIMVIILLAGVCLIIFSGAGSL